MTLSKYEQTIAYSRIYGLYVALCWLTGFYFFVLRLTLDSVVCFACFLLTPVLLYGFAKRFRETRSGGVLTFGQALLLIFMTCAHASLLTAVGVWVYFSFLDAGSFVSLMETSLNALDTEIFEKAYGMPKTEAMQMVSAFSELRPIDITFGYLLDSLFASIFVSVVVALFVKKTRVSDGYSV